MLRAGTWTRATGAVAVVSAIAYLAIIFAIARPRSPREASASRIVVPV
jgi:hypothetical protein